MRELGQDKHKQFSQNSKMLLAKKYYKSFIMSFKNFKPFTKLLNFNYVLLGMFTN